MMRMRFARVRAIISSSANAAREQVDAIERETLGQWCVYGEEHAPHYCGGEPMKGSDRCEDHQLRPPKLPLIGGKGKWRKLKKQ